MRKGIKQILLFFAAGFVFLFFFRLAYGFHTYPVAQSSAVYRPSFDYEVKNYASSKIQVKGGAGAQTSYTVDQKYEKIATLNVESQNFDQDEEKIRKVTHNYQAVVQYEQKKGLEGSRLLHLLLGVTAENFDLIVAELKEIGELTAFNIDKFDKTNEYQELQAERKSLEETRDSLLALKSRDGHIEEFIYLENRILEINEIIQSLGVKLGEFDSQMEFCTVKLTLGERGKPKPISFLHRFKVALEWTIKYYLLALGMVFMASLASLALISLFEKLKVIQMFFEEKPFRHREDKGLDQ